MSRRSFCRNLTFLIHVIQKLKEPCIYYVARPWSTVVTQGPPGVFGVGGCASFFVQNDLGDSPEDQQSSGPIAKNIMD